MARARVTANDFDTENSFTFLELSDPGKTANGYFHPSSIHFLLRLDIYLYRPPSHVDICEFIFISFLRKDNGPVSAKSEDV